MITITITTKMKTKMLLKLPTTTAMIATSQ